MAISELQNTCLNCGHVFSGAYCSACGQKHGPPMPTASELAGEFLRSALSPEGKMFESLRTLLLKPGELSRVYFAGQRLRFVHPVRLYLLGVFLFAATASVNSTWREWHGEPQFEIAASDVFAQPRKTASDTSTPQTNASSDQTQGAAQSSAQNTARKAGEEIGRSMKQALPEWMREWITRRAERSKNLSAEELREKAVRASSGHYSLIFALLVPFLALVNWLLYYRRRVSYAGHVVFMLHGTAASCLMLLVPYALNLPILYFPVTLLTIAWYVLAARRAFAVSAWGALWRYLVLMLPAIVLSTIAGIVVAAVVIVFA
jgi:Protein of unknown function (DUF3667)